MYMGPIVAAPRVRSSSPALRAVAGVAAMALMLLMLAPWLAVDPVTSVAVIGLLALARGPRALWRTIDRTGTAVIGR